MKKNKQNPKCKYDSTKENLIHIKKVNDLLLNVVSKLLLRAKNHDSTKLVYPEKEVFDKFVPKLKHCIYGSKEYKEHLKGMGKGLEHHYRNNSHHPEHYERGINGFDLFDLTEMLCDWMAATEKHKDGNNIWDSLNINAKRFNISEQLCDILRNTVNTIHNK
jgi:hypothetical protein